MYRPSSSELSAAQAAAAAEKEFRAFQKQCIADDLLNRVVVSESPVKAFVRKNREDVWSDQIDTIRAAGIFERANKIA